MLGLGAAALAGTVSFASPCCVPLVPGYLSYLAGLSGDDADQGAGRRVRAAGRRCYSSAGSPQCSSREPHRCSG